jgi:hypothetical protein
MLIFHGEPLMKLCWNTACCEPTWFVIMHTPVSPGVQVEVCRAISCWMCSRIRHSWWWGLSGGVLYKISTVLLPLNILISCLFMALLSHGSVSSVTNTLPKHIFLDLNSCKFVYHWTTLHWSWILFAMIFICGRARRMLNCTTLKIITL